MLAHYAVSPQAAQDYAYCRGQESLLHQVALYYKRMINGGSAQFHAITRLDLQLVSVEGAFESYLCLGG